MDKNSSHLKFELREGTNLFAQKSCTCTFVHVYLQMVTVNLHRMTLSKDTLVILSLDAASFCSQKVLSRRIFEWQIFFCVASDRRSSAYKMKCLQFHMRAALEARGRGFLMS